MKTALVYLNNDKLVSRGVGYVLQTALNAGFQVDLIDTAWTRTYNLDKYDVVLLSATSLYWERAKKVATQIKTNTPNKVVVLGGVHATIGPNSVLAECDAIDYVCSGEGEQFIVPFLNAISSGEVPKDGSIPFLSQRGDNFIIGHRRHQLTNLEHLPPFDYSLWHPKSVIRDEGNLFPGFCYVFATRGCPYRCSYCSNTQFLDIFGSDYLRTHAIHTVLTELRYLRDNYPLRLAYFGDEMITFKKHYCEDLFTAVAKEGIRYGCMFRPEAVTQEFVDLLCRTGCEYVATGIECGDETFRRQFLNRTYTNERLYYAFNLLRTIPRVFITAFTMKGFPVSYDYQLTHATRKVLDKLKPDHTQCTWYYPLPGTVLGRHCVSHGLIDHEKVAREDYFRESILRQPIPLSADTPIYC